MGRVLVTGAAGLIGRAVLDRLSGSAVTALVREPAELPADRVVVGDAADPAVVADALDGVDAVIHLAAIPAPIGVEPVTLYATNTQATFAVLDGAGRAGVRAAAIASSYAVCGLPFATRELRMPYLPIDSALPLQPTDPYALSKRADELTADMIHRTYDMTVVALRLPFVGTVDDRLPAMARRYAADPASGASDVWSYLDARDAADALVRALTPAEPGLHVVYVAAPDTLTARPTDELLDAFHPGVPRPHFPGRAVPIDLGPARDLLGFAAAHPYPVEGIR